jgi:hypothetical protein
MLLYIIAPVFIVCYIFAWVKLIQKRKRLEAVYNFRMQLFYNLPRDQYEQLPSFDEMLKDKCELTVENYLHEQQYA